MMAPRAWPLAVVPVIWSVIGGSAARVLGVRADCALPIAGVALALYTLLPRAATRVPGETASTHAREASPAR